MRKSVCIATALLASALPVLAQPSERPEIPVLTVQGLGQVRTDPDQASVQLGVVARQPTARAAQDEANRVAAAILEGVAKLGVPRTDVQTSDLNLGPVYSQPRPDRSFEEPRITGYQASYVVSVRLEKLDLVGRVIDAALAAGANQLQGVSFGLRNDRAARARALEQAVAQARDKAQVIAAALGVRLDGVQEVVEGGYNLVTPSFDKRMAFEAAASAPAPTPIAAGQVGVDATVTVRYRIGGPAS
jgi:uncharacterized protein YggE